MQNPDLASLETEIKELLVEALEIPDIQPKDIDSEQPLFVEGLGLDSIDALELAIVMDGDVSMHKHHFGSVKNLAAFVAANRQDAQDAPQTK